MTALREFAEAGDWDVWQEPRKAGVPVDIMCKPGRAIASDHKRDNTCNSLWAKVKDLGLEASVMIEDIDAAAQAIQPVNGVRLFVVTQIPFAPRDFRSHTHSPSPAPPTLRAHRTQWT